MLRAIGAAHVIDYTKEDFSKAGKTYDVVFDMVHKNSYARGLSAVKPNGRYILANPRFLSMLRAPWTSRTSDKKVIFQFAGQKPEDLVALKELAEAGKIRGIVDRSYPLEQAAEAHAYVDTGQRKGTVVLTVP